MEVFVITGIELGWNCIVGVFSTYEKTQDWLEEATGTRDEDDQDHYIIHRETLK